jgi:deazaflavin-dependent oxidoreductase (nitroreductase family)
MDASVRPKGLDHPIVPRIIQLMSRANVWVYQKTGGKLGSTWRVGSAFPRGVPLLLLTTVGKKTGQPRTTPLIYLADGEDLVVVGSKGGLPGNPLWFGNLLADPHVEVQVGGKKEQRVARVADAGERARLWPLLCALYADFATYQAWTEREIPVIILARPRS